MKKCSFCNSTKTATQKGGKYPIWHFIDGRRACNNCRNRDYRKKHPDKQAEYAKRNHDKDPERFNQKFKKSLTFLGKRIFLGYNPRTGICSKCGKNTKTHLHHERYERINPVNHTVELCTGCHKRLHWDQIRAQKITL